MRRLRNDLAALERLQAESSVFRFTTQGDPPHHYRIMFRGRGLWRDHGKVKMLEKHHVEIKLGSSYPRSIPELRWLTPVYHPNISEIGMVCLGGYGTHWVPSVQLDELCTMLWDMVRYHNYDIRSPYNRDAALWVAQQQTIRFPTDDRPLRDLRAALGRVNATTAGSESSQPAKSGANGSVSPAPDRPSRITLAQLYEMARRPRRAFGARTEGQEPRALEPGNTSPPLPSNSELHDLVAAQSAAAHPRDAAPEGDRIFIVDSHSTAEARPLTEEPPAAAEAPASPPLFARTSREAVSPPRAETVDVAAEVRRLMAGRGPASRPTPSDEIVFIE
jgi:ubiquitin-protein ligase